MAEKLSLRQLLEKELSVLKELNGLSLLKKDALLKDDLDTLETIVLKEEALSRNLRMIDDACSPQVQFFLKGENNGEFSLDSKEAMELIRQVRQVAQELSLNNELNQDLIRDNLGIVQFMMNSLIPKDDETPVYGSSGKILTHKKETLVLDYKG